MRSLNIKAVLFQAIQFSISSQFGSIWSLDRALTSATTLGQTGPGSDGNERNSAFLKAPVSLEPHHQIV